MWKGHDKLIARKGLQLFKVGFQPTSILQLHPPAAVTALALNAEWSVLAVGTAHGLTLYDIVCAMQQFIKLNSGCLKHFSLVS